MPRTRAGEDDKPLIKRVEQQLSKAMPCGPSQPCLPGLHVFSAATMQTVRERSTRKRPCYTSTEQGGHKRGLQVRPLCEKAALGGRQTGGERRATAAAHPRGQQAPRGSSSSLDCHHPHTRMLREPQSKVHMTQVTHGANLAHVDWHMDVE